MRSKSKAERQQSEYLDNLTLKHNGPKTYQYRTSCGGFGLLLRNKNKAELIKNVMEKERRGWERAMDIKQENGFYVVKLVFKQKPLKEQV